MATPEELQAEIARRSQTGVTQEQVQAELMRRQQQAQQPTSEPVEETGFLESALGGLESAASIVSGAIAEPVAGIVGLAAAADPFAPEGAGAARVKQVKEALTYRPRTEIGQAEQAAVAEKLKPIGEAIKSFEESVGAGALEATGSPALAALAKTLPAATAEILTLGTATPAITTARQVARVEPKFAKQSATKQKIAELIEEGSTDKTVAKFELEKSMLSGKPKVVKDKAAVESIKQGFDEGVVAAIKGSSDADKSKMLKMVDIMEKGKKNARFAMLNRSSDIAGDSLMNRFKTVTDANKKAGQQLDSVAKSLKGQKVDHSPAVNQFIDDLDSMGITLDKNNRPNFQGSDIEGLDAPIKAVNQIINRMKSVKSNDAFEMHRLKRFIDENVTYGKAGEGLKGQTQRVLKKLRSNVDSILDENFPAYDKVNTKYSETIGAIDAFQDVAGKKMNLTGVNSDKAVGTLLRRLMSNAQSRVRLLDAVNDIESTAKKYGGKFDDDLLSQIMFVDELDNVFGPVAKTSFQGQIRQAIPTGKTDAAMKAAQAVADKLRNVNEKAAFKAIKELLSKARKTGKE